MEQDSLVLTVKQESYVSPLTLCIMRAFDTWVSCECLDGSDVYDLKLITRQNFIDERWQCFLVFVVLMEITVIYQETYLDIS